MTDKRKANRWWVLFPGAVYANNFDFDDEVTLTQARKRVRAWLGAYKIPRGTKFWPGNQQDHLP